MSRNRYGDSVESYPNVNGYGDGGYRPAPINEGEDYDSYELRNSGQRYGASSFSTPSSIPQKSRLAQSRPRADQESRAEKQISAVLELIKTEWPAMCQKECIPVQIAIQLLDVSSVGRAHEYPKFEQTHRYLQDSLKAIVHEHHQGFNSSIGTFHKIQSSIQSAQKRVRNLKESINQSKANISTTDPELKKLATASQNYNDLIHTLSEIEELRLLPDQLEARISEKRFIAAVDILQTALRRIRVPELDEIGALSEIKNYFNNQEIALIDILIEELHDQLYLKSPFCQERWQMIAECQRELSSGKIEKLTSLQPFYEILNSLDLSGSSIESLSINSDIDTFHYIELLVESLNKLGRLEFAVNKIKQRLPVELYAIVSETNSEVDQKHPSSLRGSITTTFGDQSFDSREKSIRSSVIYDLLWTLYAKFESIAENHRIFHEVIKAVARRDGDQDTSKLLGGFRELLNLYQNEIQSLLRNYVTTDADVYHFSSSRLESSQQDLKRENLFRFSDTDTKSVQMTVEYQELENIIRFAVPGLMSGGKPGSDGKKSFQKSERSLGRNSLRKEVSNLGNENKFDGIESHKSLVEPSVFNMSLLLPPTLEFLQRLKTIVPPGSDIVTSTLTSFLDNFLVNVFLPQLDETLGKLSDSLFEKPDAFQQDSRWTSVSRRPVFKGTISFFNLITAFSQMLNNIPHDQALSQLIITQMIRYYEHCYVRYKSLMSKFRDSEAMILKLSASLATSPSDIHATMLELWTSRDYSGDLYRDQLEKEVTQLISLAKETPPLQDDIIIDREVISSLCMLYTSMKWLAIKIQELRYITRNNNDSSCTSTKKPITRRWTLSNRISRPKTDQDSVYLPMTEETVVGFDSIVTSYKELATTVLLTLHMEIRCETIHSLAVTLSPETTVSYLLDQVVKEPDLKILAFNADLLCYDETVVKFLPEREVSFIRRGLSLLVDKFLVANASLVGALNAYGCERILLNIFVLQQNLKAIEPDVSLSRAAKFFNLFNGGPDSILKYVNQIKETDGKQLFSYEELKILIGLCYSEQLSNPERGNITIAKRNMGDHLLKLSEYM